MQPAGRKAAGGLRQHTGKTRRPRHRLLPQAVQEAWPPDMCLHSASVHRDSDRKAQYVL